MRLLLADQSEQVPRAVRQDDAMDFRVVLHRPQGVVERLLRRALRQTGESLFGGMYVLAAHRFAQLFPALAAARSRSRQNGFQYFPLASAMFLYARGVSIEHLEYRQRLRFGGQLLRNVKCRRERHHRVESDIILAAKSA